MRTAEIINEIERLPIGQRILVLERTIQSIRANSLKMKMEQAAEELQAEYRTNKELTVFTDLDLENFYETR